MATIEQIDNLLKAKSIYVLKTQYTEVTLRFGTIDSAAFEWEGQRHVGEPPFGIYEEERPDWQPDLCPIVVILRKCWQALDDLDAFIDKGYLICIEVDGNRNCRAVFKFQCPNDVVFKNRRFIVEAVGPDAEVKFRVVGSGDFKLH